MDLVVERGASLEHVYRSIKYNRRIPKKNREWIKAKIRVSRRKAKKNEMLSFERFKTFQYINNKY